jgi:glycosyltransferase involved in cell wall biosynthesis
VTNHGGGGGFVLNRKLPILQLYSGAFANSGFAVKVLPKELRTKAVLVKGGVDIGKFAPDRSCAREKKILYVGRIVPHKGLDVLIEALRLLEAPGYRLTIVGHTRHDRYYGDIKRLARGLDVEFIHDADDEQLLHHYRSARVTVLPSVHTDCYGNYHPMPELMGFTLLESQACGTPVVCTDAGGMHEFVDDGRTGFVVTQGSPAALAAALKHLVALSDERYAELGRCCRAWVEPLSWKAVARRHLELYETLR